MGKHSRIKASAKDRRRQLHHPDAPAAVVHPGMEEEAPVSRPMEAVPDVDAPPRKTAVGEGRAAPTTKAASNGGHLSSARAEEVQHLRTLNGILAKQMVEARQERDQDQVLLSEIERAAVAAALASQLSEEGGRLTRVAGEKGRADGAEAARMEVAGVMEQRLAEAESRWLAVLAEVEKKSAAARDENARLTKDLVELAEEKTEVEKMLRAAAAEAAAITGNLEDGWKALEVAREENRRCQNELQGLVLERDDARKLLRAQAEERKALELNISNLERRHEETKRALDLSLSRCRALEEEIEKKDAAAALLTEAKEAVEAEYADLSMLCSSFNSDLASLRDEHGSLQAERDDLRAQVSELSASNGHTQQAFERLQAELKKLTEENKQNTRSHQSQVEGYLQQIEDLRREMLAAAGEREVLKKESGEQKDEIFELQEAVANLNSELTSQKEVYGNLVREKEALLAEKNGVQERLGEQTLKAEELVQELREVEMSRSAALKKLVELQSVNAQLQEEKAAMEWGVDALREERTSVERGLAVSEGRRENAEKMVGALQKLTNEALTMMRNAAAEAARSVGGAEGGREGRAAEEEDVVEVGDARPFAAEVEAIRRALRRKEEEMEQMRREIARQLESVEGAQRANVSWKWVSSAMAAVSTTALAWAITARGR